MKQEFIKRMRRPALYGLICSVIQVLLLVCSIFIIFRPGNILPTLETIFMYVALWPIFLSKIGGSIFSLNLLISFILISFVTYTIFWTIIEFVSKKIKIIILITTPLAIVTLILFIFYIPISKVYFYERETNTPMANEYIEMKYSPLCVESPCNNKIIYSGYTKEDGSIRIPFEHSNSVNKKYPLLESPYDIYFNIEGYSRWIDPENTLDQSSNIVYFVN